MDPLCVRASAANPTLTGDRSRLMFLKPLLLIIALLCGALTASPAGAYLVTTTGTITSGTETGGLFGLPTATTSLAGDSYTLIVNYAGLGPNYFTTADGSFAQD